MLPGSSTTTLPLSLILPLTPRIRKLFVHLTNTVVHYISGFFSLLAAEGRTAKRCVDFRKK